MPVIISVIGYNAEILCWQCLHLPLRKR